MADPVDGEVRVTQNVAEVLVTTTRPVRVTQTGVEILTTSARPVRVTQQSVEVIRSVTAATARARRVLITQGG